MTLLSTLSFTIAMLVLAASPGPGVFSTVSRSLSCGFRPALAVISGIILGDIIFLLFAIFGLAILAQTLGSFFIIIKLLGGGYLIWLGIKTFCSDASPTEANAGATTSKSGIGNVWKGCNCISKGGIDITALQKEIQIYGTGNSISATSNYR